MTRDEARETRCYYDSTRCDKCDGVVELHGQEYVDDGSVVPDAVYRAGYAAGRRAGLEEAAKRADAYFIVGDEGDPYNEGAEYAAGRIANAIRALLDEEKSGLPPHTP